MGQSNVVVQILEELRQGTNEDHRDQWITDDRTLKKISQTTGWQLKRIAGVRANLRPRRSALVYSALLEEFRTQSVNNALRNGEAEEEAFELLMLEAGGFSASLAPAPRPSEEDGRGF